MNQARALRLIRKHKPQNVPQFETLGIKLKFLGYGSFREAYRIADTKLVVKFPVEEDKGDEYSSRDGKRHTTNEVKKITTLRELVPEMKMHLPRIYYHDPESGVLVCSYHEEYRSFEDKNSNPYHESVMVDNLGQIVTKLIRHITGMKCADLHYGNIHKLKRVGKYSDYTDAVLIDLGY